MSTSLFPDKTTQHMYLCNTLDIDLIVFSCVCMYMFLLFSLFLVMFPTWGYSMMIDWLIDWLIPGPFVRFRMGLGTSLHHYLLSMYNTVLQATNAECSWSHSVTMCILWTVDVDECAGDTDMCHLNATCNNTQGSYTCSCNTGYAGNGLFCISKYIFSSAYSYVSKHVVQMYHFVAELGAHFFFFFFLLFVIYLSPYAYQLSIPSLINIPTE